MRIRRRAGRRGHTGDSGVSGRPGSCGPRFRHGQRWLVPAGLTSTTLPSSFCRFDGELVEEGTPAGIVYLFSEHAFGHALDVQVFDGDELVVVDDLASELVYEVGASVGNALVYLLEFPDSLSASVRSSGASGDLALRPSQAFLGALVPARVRYEVSGAEGGEVFEAYDADFRVCFGQRFGLAFYAEADVPAAGVAPHGDGLDPADDLAVPLDAQFAHAL